MGLGLEPPPQPDSEAASVPTAPTSAGRRRKEIVKDIARKLPSSMQIMHGLLTDVPGKRLVRLPLAFSVLAKASQRFRLETQSQPGNDGGICLK